MWSLESLLLGLKTSHTESGLAASGSRVERRRNITEKKHDDEDNNSQMRCSTSNSQCMLESLKITYIEASV